MAADEPAKPSLAATLATAEDAELKEAVKEAEGAEARQEASVV